MLMLLFEDLIVELFVELCEMLIVVVVVVLYLLVLLVEDLLVVL